MNKNILIVVLLVVIAVLLFRHKVTSINTPTNQIFQENTLGEKSATYNYNGTKFMYDPDLWEPTDNRYCSPADGENGKKYDGTPCDLIGFTFQYKGAGANNTDTIVMGGWQPMACDVIQNKTKCSDAYSMVTSSNKKEVLDYYDYLISLFP